MATAKRGRPPNLTLQAAPAAPPSIELESPHDDEGLDLAGDLSLDSPGPLSGSDEENDISKSLERLELLRQNVQKNLRLRPIRSNGSLPKVQLGDTSPWDPSIGSPASSISAYFTPAGEGPLSAKFVGSTPPPVPSPSRKGQAIEPGALFKRLSGPRRPLLIDTRPPAAHLAFHIRDSINLAIPSLILKRTKKTPFQSLDALRQYVTTEKGKRDWDTLMNPGGPWNGDVVVYAEEEDTTLLPVIAPLLSYGTVDYLKGGISSAGHHPELETLILSDSDNHERNSGLFQLDTHAALRSKTLPEIDSRSSMDMSSLNINLPPPTFPTSAHVLDDVLCLYIWRRSGKHCGRLALPAPLSSRFSASATPAPAPFCAQPAQTGHKVRRAPQTLCQTRPLEITHFPRPSTAIPTPRYLRAVTVHALVALVAHLGLRRVPHRILHAAAYTWHPQRDPPATARPEDPPTTEEAMGEFTISTILPNFLFLGPELTLPEHVKELQTLGVKRILNIAIECDADDHGLRLKEEFERYSKIPMRDTVEEENISRGVREVCEILDDARLHSAATYVHCKAGKSRSVTAVMAYLIHANHWTLSRAYAFVLERRKGISPNIGFVSELMTFEEEELGGKSIGVQPNVDGGDTHGHGGPGAGHAHNANYGVAAGGRRGGHVRESLPPAFSQTQSFSAAPDTQDFGGGDTSEMLGNSGQDMEVRDAAGRYRHARRAPVDENTLQPMRRVSKAGLESSAYGYAGS
ncbi:hypothetical protein MSAN_00556800 [Mycena sanguinolenta]|uniref:protein-tyrosine-phosphatase n=1 Tax=Mycena sanguinolenta TaxID=230812 RepID=A0A8H6ZAS1_9AGAR|nr:hypothetical protein MSAN_00556800 [Mycena sanguinolenta]